MYTSLNTTGTLTCQDCKLNLINISLIGYFPLSIYFVSWFGTCSTGCFYPYLVGLLNWICPNADEVILKSFIRFHVGHDLWNLMASPVRNEITFCVPVFLFQGYVYVSHTWLSNSGDKRCPWKITRRNLDGVFWSFKWSKSFHALSCHWLNDGDIIFITYPRHSARLWYLYWWCTVDTTVQY